MTDEDVAEPSDGDADPATRHFPIDVGGPPPGDVEGNDTPDDAETADESDLPSRPSTRRHLTVLAVLVLAFVVGVALVMNGRSTPKATPPGTTAPSPQLTWLGGFPSAEAATRALGTLDPIMLRPRPGTSALETSTTDTTALGTDSASARSRPTSAAAKRCAISVQMQSADRNLGELNASIGLAVNGTMSLAQSFKLPASGKNPGGTRIMVSNAQSCQVQFAFDVPSQP